MNNFDGKLRLIEEILRGGFRQQIIAETNVELDIFRHMASLNHNVLKGGFFHNDLIDIQPNL